MHFTEKDSETQSVTSGKGVRTHLKRGQRALEGAGGLSAQQIFTNYMLFSSDICCRALV